MFPSADFAHPLPCVLSRIAVCTLLLSLTSSGQSETSLREVAQRRGILVGAAVRPQRFTEKRYAATLAREFNLAEPEDALKWEVLRPTPTLFDFLQGDRVVDFAVAHGMKIRGHTLVWHRQLPTWLQDGNYTAAELKELLRTHIKTVVSHYRGKIFAWDVVNEAFDEPVSRRLRSTVWSDRPGIGAKGTAYIEQSFRWAHEADPDALLFFNEAEVETINLKSDAVYAMASDFLSRGVPMDGIGIEMHISDLHPDFNSIERNIHRFAKLGLQVHITEMDVSLPVNGQGISDSRDLALQAQIYGRIAAICLAEPKCTALQVWGVSDRYSWIGSHSHGKRGAALLFDREYLPKPAHKALVEVIGKDKR